VKTDFSFEVSIAPIRLEKCLYPVIELEANPDFAQNNDPGNSPVMKVDFEGLNFELNDEYPNSFILTLPILLTWENTDNPPYRKAMIRAVGMFSWHPETKDDFREVLMTTSGPSMLYSSAREFLRIITGSGPWGELILPAVFVRPAPDDEDPKNAD
jgi:preprotein translocase subunit SecB